MKEKKKKKQEKQEKQEKRREEEKQKKGKKKKKKEKAEQSAFTEQEAITEQKRSTGQKTLPEERSFEAQMQTSEPDESTQVSLEDREELQEEQASLLFRALGDPVRLRILGLLEERELCAAELLKSLSIVQSTLSHHMKVLCEAGIVSCRRHGRWSYYSVAAERMEQAAGYLRRYGKGTAHRES